MRGFVSLLSVLNVCYLLVNIETSDTKSRRIHTCYALWESEYSACSYNEKLKKLQRRINCI